MPPQQAFNDSMRRNVESQDVCIRKVDPAKLTARLKKNFGNDFEVYVRHPSVGNTIARESGDGD